MKKLLILPIATVCALLLIGAASTVVSRFKAINLDGTVPGTPANGDIWYSTAGNTLNARINGVTVKLGAVAPVILTDAATIATDASLGSLFRVTLGGNRTLGNPTNPTDGQRATWTFIQDATGVRTITMDTKFAFGTDITGITLTTNATKRDFLTAIYNSTEDKWYCVGFSRGF